MGSPNQWDQAPWSKSRVDAENPHRPVHEYGIDGERHEKHVNAVARRNPHPQPRFQGAPKHETNSPTEHRAGDEEAINQHSPCWGVNEAHLGSVGVVRQDGFITYNEMPHFESDDVQIAYELHGPADGPPVLLVHGFASDYRLNWVGTRWQETLQGAGRRVIGIDCRGHGFSDKPHKSAAYLRRTMALDCIRLLDHLGVARADWIGYSMGARLVLEAALASGSRTRRAVLGGIGLAGESNLTMELIARRLRGDLGVTHPTALVFHRFAAARAVNDLEALAWCISGGGPDLRPESLARLTAPALVVLGERDPLAASGRDLARILPAGELLLLKGRDHLGAVPATAFREAAVAFLDRPAPPAPAPSRALSPA